MALVAIAVAGPMAIICIYTLVVDGLFSHRINGLKKKYTIKDRLWELNCGLLGLGLAIAMQYVIVGTKTHQNKGKSLGLTLFRKLKECDWQTETRSDRQVRDQRILSLEFAKLL